MLDGVLCDRAEQRVTNLSSTVGSMTNRSAPAAALTSAGAGSPASGRSTRRGLTSMPTMAPSIRSSINARLLAVAAWAEPEALTTSRVAPRIPASSAAQRSARAESAEPSTPTTIRSASPPGPAEPTTTTGHGSTGDALPADRADPEAQDPTPTTRPHDEQVAARCRFGQLGRRLSHGHHPDDGQCGPRARTTRRTASFNRPQAASSSGERSARRSSGPRG